MLYRESSLKLDFVCNSTLLPRNVERLFLLPSKSAPNDLARGSPTLVLLRLPTLELTNDHSGPNGPSNRNISQASLQVWKRQSAQISARPGNRPRNSSQSRTKSPATEGPASPPDLATTRGSLRARHRLPLYVLSVSLLRASRITTTHK